MSVNEYTASASRPAGVAKELLEGLQLALMLAVTAALGAWAAADAPVPTLTAGGYVRAARVVYVTPRVRGRILALHVKEGDEVQARLRSLQARRRGSRGISPAGDFVSPDVNEPGPGGGRLAGDAAVKGNPHESVRGRERSWSRDRIG
jgi:hypothetical protein